MSLYDNEIERIRNQIIEKYNPVDIILFGSCAKGRVTKKSDVDICVIMPMTNRRETVQSILLNVEYDVDLDVVVYTPEEWQKYKDDMATFAGIINKTGVSLIG